MKNNKGFTLVELITSFALASVIMIFIFNIVVILKNNYISKSVRTDLLIKQSLLSQKMNEDFTNNNVKDVVTCDSDKKCYEFTFADDTVKQLKISADDKTITYGDYTYELTNSSYASKINVSAKSITLDDVTLNDSLLVIDIPILNKKYTDTNFGVKVVYQYNSHIVDLNTEEVTPFAFNVGDYVIMTPTSTSFATDPAMTGYATSQTINPSELNVWRIIDVKSNGRVDMVSEYVSSVDINFSGVKGYKNYIGYLNTIAAQYANNSYTVSTRYAGYSDQTKILTSTSYYDGSNYNVSSWTTSTTDNSKETIGGGDYGKKDADINLIKAIGSVQANNAKAYRIGTTDVTKYWIASRYYYHVKDNSASPAVEKFSFRGDAIAINGLSDSINIREYDLYDNGVKEWVNAENSSAAIRPIVTLKAGVTPSSGNGTAASPYVLD
ncbi:MAG: prepilin-type N-terminal cleavage/methylation domain-containing protein [Bacilli bacterium]|nr:prepilin-type N-terminal cleavage/methylation domain-containing protein [Bacilli bacterium]